MDTRKPNLINGMLVACILTLGLAGASPAQAATANGYCRPVNIAVLTWFLYHTYEYYSGYGYATFTGSASGGDLKKTTTTIYAGELTCMQKSGQLTYAVTGVCHNGTNRGLYETNIDYVIDWGGVKGSGTSYNLYCTFGAGISCYGPPC